MPEAARWLYRALSTALLCGGVAALPVLALARRRWLEGLPERLGRAPRLASAAPWIHAASVGEVRLALPLLRALSERGLGACLSTTSRTGRDLARRERPGLPSFLAPLDHPFSVRTAFDRLRPSVLALLETELWPELLGTALQRSVPVILLNGRISDRSFGRYRLLRPLLAPLLAGLCGVVPRSETDRERLVALGCRPEACRESGDLKGASLPEPHPRPWRSAGPLVLVAGSLHRGEFEPYLELVRRTHGLAVAHVIAPRHLERVAELVAGLRSAEVPFELWSAHRPRFPDPPPSVLVVDTHGDLASLYGEGDAAFVGGSLDSAGGGHNVFEPAATGRAVLFGPGMADHKTAAEALLANGGAVAVRDTAELAERVTGWLAGREELRVRGASALRAARDAYGAGQRTLERSVSLLLETQGLAPC
jgi:3-deoxy-D-manno-octulosonic-acid transferase